MKNINWLVRIKNKAFWVALIPAVLLLIQVIAAVFGYTLDLGNLGNKLLDVVNAVFAVLVMFNFKEDCIEPEGMHGGWQTSGTVKVCHIAFNLWNGYAEEGRERYFTPEELFCCEFAPYFMEGIKVRYPEYCRELPAPRKQTEISR